MARRTVGSTLALCLLAAVFALAASAASAASGPSFTGASASGDVSNWRVTFTESGLAPGAKVAYSMGARIALTFNCSSYLGSDHLGIGHGAPQHFRIYSNLAHGFSANANSSGVVRRSVSVPEGISAPTCSDGSASSVSSYALYRVVVLDSTNRVSAHSLREHTQPRPR